MGALAVCRLWGCGPPDLEVGAGGETPKPQGLALGSWFLVPSPPPPPPIPEELAAPHTHCPMMSRHPPLLPQRPEGLACDRLVRS